MNLKKSFLVFALLILAVGASMLYAGTTGKIAGRVIDASTGEPLIATNIVLRGTQLGVASDIEGNYAIINIPPGVYTVVVTMIGYRQVQYENVQVNSDLTTRLFAELQPTALELDAVVVTAERKLVVKDMTGSLSTTTADQIQNLPVQNLQQVLRLNAGVIESDGRLHMRGGRPGEIAYWVDGISATDVYDGRIGTTVENSAVQEVQVVSGTFNAEYGQAMSGIVNIITKEGGSNYTGQLKVYGGDYVSNDEKFGLYQGIMDSTGKKVLPGDFENPLKKINPIYNAEFSLSGPMPFIGDVVTFFINGRYFSDEGFYYGRNWYRPNGTLGDLSIIPMNPNVALSLQGKLNIQLGSALKWINSVFLNKSDRDRNYFRANTADYQFNTSGQSGFTQFNTHNFKYVPNALPQLHTKGMSVISSLNYIISPSTFFEFRLSGNYSESKQYVFDDPTTANKYLVNIMQDDTKGIRPETFDPYTAAGKTKLDSIVALGGKYEYTPDPNGPVGYIDPESINQPTSYSYMNKGMDVTNTNRSTFYGVGKLDLTTQLNKTHQLKVGAEARMYKLTLHGYQIVAATDVSGQPINPFVPAIPPVNSMYKNDYDKSPHEISAYIQNKTEYNDIIVNLGIRFDYFDPNAVIPTDPTDPNIYGPFKYKNRYAGWIEKPDTSSLTTDEYIQKLLASGQIREYTPDERRAFMHTKVKAKMAVSPRFGVAFPITDRGVIHFSYGHFYQTPEFQYLYTNPDFKVSSGSGYALFGNADLNPQKTVMYELGLQQQIANDIGIDVTLFYRDVRDWVGTSPLIQTSKTGVAYSKFENKDYENVKGITVKVEKRLSDNYSFRADYTYQSAEGTYSNPADAYNQALAGQAPVLSLLPMNWDQKHTFNAQFILNVSSWTVSLIGRYWSGRPYTPQFPVAESVGGSAVSGLTTNSARRPDQTNLDLTINKSFKLYSKLNLEFFVNVYNVLDQRDATSVYADTGSPDYTTTIRPSTIPYNANRISTVEDYVNQPSWYTAPRRIEVGLILDF
jgi:hypothetical protein